ncbi:MAG: 2-phospho-L-lactate transferase [Acidimicrobiales bacterium]
MITVLAGGVGAARLLAGLVLVQPADGITAIVNTADDEIIHGLSISPDLDTITYTLAGAIDPARGWGLAGESWAAMDALDRYQPFRPPDSGAANTWFRLGDRDLATHLYRSARLAEGADLTTVTNEIARAWGVQVRLVPMTDDRVATRLTVAAGAAEGSAGDGSAAGGGVADGGGSTEISFQDYFVRLRHGVAVSSIRYHGADEALPNPIALEAIDRAERILIAPSNPLLSIAPILAPSGMRERLIARRDDVVAVSPIVNGAAVKGPADRLLTELGFEASVVGVARLYAEIASTLVVDETDSHHRAAVEACGMACLVTGTVMRTPVEAAALARVLLGKAG